ncbi:hypothetical protein ACQKKE_12335 [Desemzia incerta]|uniref:hypothetical protein n=1 Tax=Desemzia incerta TaxID=82801 RepID=UPI003D04C28D
MENHYTKKKHKNTFGLFFCILLSFAIGSIFTYFLMSFDTLKSLEQYEEDNVSVSKSDSTNSEIITDPVSQ